MNEQINVNAEALAGKPDEEVICLVVTPNCVLRSSQIHEVHQQVVQFFVGTKWEALKVLVAPRGWKLEAVSLPASEAAKLETWRDREPML